MQGVRVMGRSLPLAWHSATQLLAVPGILSKGEVDPLKDQIHRIMGRVWVTLRCPEMMKQF